MLALFLITIAVYAGSPDLELPFQLDSRYDAILIQAEVNGKPATLLLDTGAAQTVLDARLLGLTNLDLKMSRFSQSGPGLRGEAVWAEARLKLGARTWHEQRVVAMNLDPLASRYGRRIHGLLGQDILRQFARVTIDFRTRTLILVPSANEPANAKPTIAQEQEIVTMSVDCRKTPPMGEVATTRLASCQSFRRRGSEIQARCFARRLFHTA